MPDATTRRSEPAPTRDAASLLLVRDAHGPDGDGLEVCMLRRNMDSSFAAGVYVFPGGKVDAEDRSSLAESLCVGVTDSDASALVGVAAGGLAFWVTAIRECFEEAGVLLAYPDGVEAGGAPYEPLGEEAAGRLAEQRAALNGGATTFLELCRANGLRLAVDRLAYLSHWIAPEVAPVRFDTRFFVAALPPGQVPVHDDHEMVETAWVRPADAVDEALSGKLDMVFPTIKHLAAIEHFATSDDLLAAARADRHIPTIMPELVTRDGEQYMVLTADIWSDGTKTPPDGGVPLSSRQLALLRHGVKGWRPPRSK
jgi:8-oxo-dGTP pyrophosphatase MutT (NUDIX family)